MKLFVVHLEHPKGTALMLPYKSKYYIQLFIYIAKLATIVRPLPSCPADYIALPPKPKPIIKD